jgi:3-hydroxybutyryl-CoA dehydrogenase
VFPEPLTHVAVLGTGIMGSGIAVAFARGGRDVTVIGRREASVAACEAAVRRDIATLHEAALLEPGDSPDDVTARISYTTARAAAEGSDLVVEAVVEDLEVKRALFRELEAVCPPGVILGSASGQPATVVAGESPHPERYAAIHFWNPAPFVPLVELSGTERTDPRVLDWLRTELGRIGKAPVVLRVDQPGLLGNRLQFALLREAVSMWAGGVATAQDIDLAVTAGFGRRLAITGPLASADLAGLGTMEAFARSVFPFLADADEPPPQLGEVVRTGGHLALGPEDRAEVARRRIEELVRWTMIDRTLRSAQDDPSVASPGGQPEPLG